MSESCHTHTWVSHVTDSYVWLIHSVICVTHAYKYIMSRTDTNESCHTLIRRRQTHTDMNAAWHSYEWVMSHTPIHASCHTSESRSKNKNTHEQVMPQLHILALHHTHTSVRPATHSYECDMSHSSGEKKSASYHVQQGIIITETQLRDSKLFAGVHAYIHDFFPRIPW